MSQYCAMERKSEYSEKVAVFWHYRPNSTNHFLYERYIEMVS